MRFLIISMGALTLTVACGGPFNGEVEWTPRPEPTPKGPFTSAGQSAQPAPVQGRTLDDSAISDFYRQVSPKGPIGTPGPGDLYAAIPPDGIQPIYTPKFVSAAEASFLQPEELVMGVDINGETRAYPVGLMRIREIANDDIGGVPVLVTW